MYRSRFAPSPSGPLHAGSLVAALASWLDARAHGGAWLIRIEDVDTPRTVPGADQHILHQLAACNLIADEPVQWQSRRTAGYAQALQQLRQQGRAYPCHCSRKAILAALQAQGSARARHGELRYPGTCRPSNAALTQAVGTGPSNAAAAPVAWRLLVPNFESFRALEPMDHAQAAITLVADSTLSWLDRRLGTQQQDVPATVGDFVLQRADGCFTYQLAVVVDDAAQGITHVVRGEDLADNTARQILLQRALGLPTPQYLHTPLVRDAQGEKLSKQTGAQALDTATPTAARAALGQAARVLGLADPPEPDAAQALAGWVAPWRERYGSMPGLVGAG